MSWITISVLLLFAAAFLNGLIFGFLNSLISVIWIPCSILIAAILGGSKIWKSIKENAGIKKIIVAILIVLVLIPLVMFGTCLLIVGGTLVRGSFIR